MGVQDDRREEEQRELFELKLPDDRSRIGTDAILEMDSKLVEFELKSTTKESVTTVRDFGIDHLEKWEGKHWLFGFYTKHGKALRYTRYASPKMMEAWINAKREYIRRDFLLADLTPKLISLDVVHELLGQKAKYSLGDAELIQKKQHSRDEYMALMDLENGYTPNRMLDIVRKRCAYVLRRGSTLNNPHIPPSVLKDFPKIVDNHAAKLREYVHQALQANA